MEIPKRVISLVILDKRNASESEELLSFVERNVRHLNAAGLFVKMIPIKPKTFSVLQKRGELSQLPCVIIDGHRYGGNAKASIQNAFDEMRHVAAMQQRQQKAEQLESLSSDNMKEHLAEEMRKDTEQEQEDDTARNNEIQAKIAEMSRRREAANMRQDNRHEQRTMPPAVGGDRDEDEGRVRPPPIPQPPPGRPMRPIPQGNFGGNRDDDMLASRFRDELEDEFDM